MPFVAIVTVVALLQFFWLALQVGFARTRYGVAAPATSGNEIFERHFRVHMNTQELLVMFLPTLWIFAAYVSPLWAAALGVVFVLGRAIYAISYVRDPKSRSLGFGLSIFPVLIMLIGIGVWAIRAILMGAAG
ncbi:MAPEG family protein [Peristeroidobacter agariperforans]|uniref:MAPEG family protein n=1 Tax=Peristeroidobacter agariperforans TaxID=268404 RepID=UPI00101CBDD7|nr:MAPEG family protein [Peristeroidobacter agariperforans]